ncbi:hypothetical protein CcaverHIS002_0308130 [Cutaneotrichosporon cavernicola]|uniref:Uncharacterized protein n=1 Tax=Cutaneotrichosporon cavernicola TaxID=279322 RepID=A0AA48I415_9TREE|nr:uncharacterized protein CcaverHIS019_0308010 [Cutaneotrichosporon cavernicola]BEI82945.1 hypothetical protein CcaverHIS002_0308130 [Cutaneotrichosporon cavernicola]BEI90731.1 hypothetical protein CcaverHIS019_0308010 [Cutaneotrichosporon cavernicola]BEI98511.1 hypothetical protein CcaverHIS631_0308100 [Cutaneotrichosporon cavernicola]BEJ06282.1 hypothetical protein CcaverHIS641_0308040 [Cutaneotrichosporon cavernicola]
MLRADIPIRFSRKAITNRARETPSAVRATVPQLWFSSAINETSALWAHHPEFFHNNPKAAERLFKAIRSNNADAAIATGLS